MLTFLLIEADSGGLVIKANADYFNTGSGGGSVWRRIEIFERRDQIRRDAAYSGSLRLAVRERQLSASNSGLLRNARDTTEKT